MNGFEPLPGLLDDPQFQFPDLPALTDFHIAPLRNPAPSRNSNVPLPLEPVTKSLDQRSRGRKGLQVEDGSETASPPRSKGITNGLLQHEGKKPHLAISELVDTQAGTGETQQLQLPSFVSLSVVEKSPITPPSHINPNKRPRLDLEADIPHHEVNRLLPRPAKKDDRKARPVPLLPAMVTGLHEPPPSAGLLPSMDPDVRPDHAAQTSSKILVKDILVEVAEVSHRKPPEAMLNTPKPEEARLPKTRGDVLVEKVRPQEETPSGTEPGESTSQLDSVTKHASPLPSPSNQGSFTTPTTSTTKKARRQRRKWTDQETRDLIAGIEKHGIAKWKYIIDDRTYTFKERTPVDLKDRYRVLPKDPAGKPLPFEPSVATITPTPPTSKDSQTTNTPTINANGQPRRRRNLWSAEEDASLLKGVQLHGFQWTTIHDDPDLDLSHRKATDLRDRIRNLMPEMYKGAETRPLRKDVLRRRCSDSGGGVGKNTMLSERCDGEATTSSIGEVGGDGGGGEQGEQGEQERTDDQGKEVKRVTNKQVDRRVEKKSSSKTRKTDKSNVATSMIPTRAASTSIPTRTEAVEIPAPQVEHAGVTLPPLDLDDDDLDWEDNTLPPLLEWEDIGI